MLVFPFWWCSSTTLPLIRNGLSGSSYYNSLSPTSCISNIWRRHNCEIIQNQNSVSLSSAAHLRKSSFHVPAHFTVSFFHEILIFIFVFYHIVLWKSVEKFGKWKVCVHSLINVCVLGYASYHLISMRSHDIITAWHIIIIPLLIPIPPSGAQSLALYPSRIGKLCKLCAERLPVCVCTISSPSLSPLEYILIHIIRLFYSW